MKRTRSFEKKDFKEGKKIIIYGAGRYGELAYWGLRNIGLEIDFFMDQNRAGETCMGISILSPKDLKNYIDDIILIASYNYFNEILQYVEGMGCKNIYDILALLTLEYDESVLSEYLKDEKHNSKKYQNVIENIAYDQLIINHCEVVVTECCTLRCKDCANLMQYYKHPQKINSKDILRDFNNFLDTIDALLDLRLLGGEPFTYKELDELIETFGKNEKIKRITIYTNSTVLPSDKMIEKMKMYGVVVHMSDYGSVSRRLSELDEILTQNEIEHYIHEYKEWHDVGDVSRRNVTGKVVQRIFDTCIMSTCYSFYRGRFYICPRAGHGEQLGYFVNKQDEYVDFTQEINKGKKREELQKLIDRKKYITACEYCNGSSLKSKTIPAAIQIESV